MQFDKCPFCRDDTEGKQKKEKGSMNKCGLCHKDSSVLCKGVMTMTGERGRASSKTPTPLASRLDCHGWTALSWGGWGKARGRHRARVEDTMWWCEKSHNIWPESINVEQQKTNILYCSTCCTCSFSFTTELLNSKCNINYRSALVVEWWLQMPTHIHT